MDTLDLVWGVIDFTPETDFPSPRAKNVIASPLTGGIAVSVLIQCRKTVGPLA